MYSYYVEITVHTARHQAIKQIHLYPHYFLFCCKENITRCQQQVHRTEYVVPTSYKTHISHTDEPMSRYASKYSIKGAL